MADSCSAWGTKQVLGPWGRMTDKKGDGQKGNGNGIRKKKGESNASAKRKAAPFGSGLSLGEGCGWLEDEAGFEFGVAVA